MSLIKSGNRNTQIRHLLPLKDFQLYKNYTQKDKLQNTPRQTALKYTSQYFCESKNTLKSYTDYKSATHRISSSDENKMPRQKRPRSLSSLNATQTYAKRVKNNLITIS